MIPESRALAVAKLTRELRARGPTLSRDLRSRLAMSPATLARTIASMRAEILATGATSSLTYAIRRVIPGLPSEIPIYEIGPEAVRLFATLHPIEPGGFFVRSSLAVHGFYTDLPWFLFDLRPAGFLGRLAPRQHPELGLPNDIQNWSADQALRWLHEWGVDTVGSLVVGEPSFRRLQQYASPEVRLEVRSERYPRLADDVMGLGVPGSSAAGEQPKFLATRVGGDERLRVLVKFSPRIVDRSTRRTADLLRCEHHALTTLRRAGVPSAGSEIVEAEGRVFLEVGRFDRQGEGRLGLVSLLAVGAREGADIHDWTASADDLVTAGVISNADREGIYWLDRFGALIGNTDRHAGNLSFFFPDGQVGPVAPVYDMLPMAYAIRSGEFSTPTLNPPVPTPRFASSWRQVWAAATEFWMVVANDAAIDEELRRAASANGAILVAQRGLLERLPADQQLPAFRPG